MKHKTLANIKTKKLNSSSWKSIQEWIVYSLTPQHYFKKKLVVVLLTTNISSIAKSPKSGREVSLFLCRSLLWAKKWEISLFFSTNMYVRDFIWNTESGMDVSKLFEKNLREYENKRKEKVRTILSGHEVSQRKGE